MPKGVSVGGSEVARRVALGNGVTPKILAVATIVVGGTVETLVAVSVELIPWQPELIKTNTSIIMLKHFGFFMGYQPDHKKR